MHHADRSVWAKIGRAVFYDLPRPENSWETFVFDDNPWIGFIILQHDVVLRLMLFDQTVFEQPSINFSIDYGKGDIADLADKNPGFGINFIRVLIEIRGDTIFKILRLSDIDQLIALIPKLVDAR